MRHGMRIVSHGVSQGTLHMARAADPAAPCWSTGAQEHRSTGAPRLCLGLGFRNQIGFRRLRSNARRQGRVYDLRICDLQHCLQSTICNLQ
jgi:hypothetical protein